MSRFKLTPPALPPELETLRADVRAFLCEELDSGRIKPHCSSLQCGFDPEFSKRAAKRGYLGITFPKAYGGHGGTFFERYIVAEEMLAAGAPVAAHWVADRQSGAHILRHGTENLRQLIIPGITRGEIYFAIGMSEPNAGSDLANISSRARKVDGGWRVTGQKIWTSNGHRAHYMIGLFRTSPRDEEKRHAGMTQLVLKLGSEGVSARPIKDMSGESDFCEMFFDDVFVPDDHVLGKVGGGWASVTGELAYERSGPDRFLSNVPLLSAAIDCFSANDDQFATLEVGRLVSRLSTLRHMSFAVAGELQLGGLPNVEAAVVKEQGARLERDMVEVLARLKTPHRQEGAAEFERLLTEAILQAPSITLRGGTPEILKGVIARSLGLR